MTADNTPGPRWFALPYASVTVHTAYNVLAYRHHQMSAQRSDHHIVSNVTDAELLRLMTSKTHSAGPMRIKILGLASDTTIGTGKEEIVRQKRIKRNGIAG